MVSSRRTRLTLSMLNDALIQLLLQKKLEEVTVKEILDKADIARSSYYYHFEGIYDQFGKIRKEFMTSMDRFWQLDWNTHYEGKSRYSSSDQDETFDDLVAFLQENKECFLALYNNVPLGEFVDELASVAKPYLDRFMRHFGHEQNDIDQYYLTLFAMNGMYVAIHDWLSSDEGRHLDRKQFSKLMSLAYSGVLKA